MNNLCKAKSKKTGEWVFGQYLFATHHHGKAVSKHWIVESVSQNGGHLCCGTKHAIDNETLCRNTGRKVGDTFIFEKDRISYEFVGNDFFPFEKREGVVEYSETLTTFVVKGHLGRLSYLKDCSYIKIIGNTYDTRGIF